MTASASMETLRNDGFTHVVRRVEIIARNSVREALRQRLLPFTLVLAVVLVTALSRIRELTFGASELRFIVDVGFGAIDLFGVVLTIGLTTQLVFDELEHRTLFTVLAKPVRRSEFLLGKFFGVAQLVVFFSAILGAVITVTLWLQANELLTTPASAGSIDYLALGAALIAQALKLMIVAAITLLVASFARTQLFTLGTSLLWCLICYVHDFIQIAGSHGTAIGRIALRLALLIGPNFRVFDFSGAIIHEIALTRADWFRVMAYGGGYIALFVMAAVWLFRRREF